MGYPAKKNPVFTYLLHTDELIVGKMLSFHCNCFFFPC